MGATEKLARFIVETKFKDIPKQAIGLATDRFIDSLGCILAGSRQPPGKLLANHVKEIGGNLDAAAIGHGFRTSVPNAVLANGAAGHLLDYDDGGLAGHVSTPLYSVALALAEKLGSSGQDIITAYVLGFETKGKLYGALGYSFKTAMARRFRANSIFDTFGATIAACKMLKLSVDQTRAALGITASEASGSYANFGTMVKGLEAGSACRKGVVSAMLARDGFTANPDVLEAHLGFGYAYGAPGTYDFDEMTRTLGQPFQIISPGGYIKTYPCMGYLERPLDAILQLMAEHKVSYEDIEYVEVGTPGDKPPIQWLDEANSGLEGKFCFKYCIAGAILDGKVNIETFTDEKARDPKMKEAQRKIRLVSRPDLPIYTGSGGLVKQPKMGNPITVRLKNGKEFTNRVDKPKGSVENPLTRDELLAKYRYCATPTLKPSQVERSIDLMLDLEHLKDVIELMDIMKAG